jgi:NAD(P)-dependent dehydrogenase (short-subunit alcohol dehydrogenase family)
VCSNAGIFSTGRVGELGEDNWRDVIDTNLTGMWHACKRLSRT